VCVCEIYIYYIYIRVLQGTIFLMFVLLNFVIRKVKIVML